MFLSLFFNVFIVSQPKENLLGILDKTMTKPQEPFKPNLSQEKKRTNKIIKKM
jgi:hypothetical protein